MSKKLHLHVFMFTAYSGTNNFNKVYVMAIANVLVSSVHSQSQTNLSSYMGQLFANYAKILPQIFKKFQ